MTSTNGERRTLELQSIQRKRVQQHLAIAAAVALLASGCYQNGPRSTDNSSPKDPNAVTSENANEKIPGVFYETVADCEADVQKQASEYAVLEAAFENKELAVKPTAPPLSKEDCGPQLEAAKQAHQEHAPNYASLGDCQAEGLECEPATTNQNAGYYRPSFGGFFFYPFLGGRTQYIYVNDGGSQRRLYQPSTVYKSAAPGQVVTPNGRVVSNPSTGVSNVPRHTSAPAPQRPSGTAARGTVTGRGSQGFGSTYKGTGRGGK